MDEQSPADPICFHQACRSPFGMLMILWSELQGRPGIERILLSKPGAPAEIRLRVEYPQAPANSCREMDEVAEKIRAFLSGEQVRFSLEIARMENCSEFQQNILRAEHGIPRGRVSTYARLAAQAGAPGAARAAGSALANNPFPILIPCHRAIHSDMTPGGYQGGARMKQTLLQMEGIHFDPSGRVVTDELYY